MEDNPEYQKSLALRTKIAEACEASGVEPNEQIGVLLSLITEISEVQTGHEITSLLIFPEEGQVVTNLLSWDDVKDRVEEMVERPS